MSEIDNYTNVNFNHVSHVKLVSEGEEGWKDYLTKKRSEESKTKGQIEREEYIQDNPESFRYFKKDVEYYTEFKKKLIDKVEGYLNHLKQASFNFHESNRYGNKRVSTPATYHKKNIIDELPWNKTHLKHHRDTDRIYFDKDALGKVKAKLNDNGYEIVEKEQFKTSTKFDIPKSYRTGENCNRIYYISIGLDVLKSENPKKEITRFAWSKHLADIDQYQFQRAEAYLRDLDSKIAEEPQIKKAQRSGAKFESEVKQKLSESGFESRDTVFKITTESENTFYKEMDYHSKIGSTHIVFEIFKQRDMQSKKRQIADYITLLNKCVTGNVKALAITTLGIEEENITKSLIGEKISSTSKYGFSSIRVSEGEF